MSGLARRVRTGVSVAAVAAGLLWLHRFFPAGGLSLAVVTILALLSAWELVRMGQLKDGRLGLPLFVAVLAVVGFTSKLDENLGVDENLRVIVSPLDLGSLYLRALVGVVMGRVACVVIGIRPGPLPKADGWAVGLALWLLPPLFSLVLLDVRFGVAGLTVLVVLAKIGDNAGFFVGRAIGKRHPFPTISPGKTVAGCVASLVAGLAGGAVILPLTLGERTLAGACLGAVLGGLINLAAQAGDLSESWVKRKAGVKDSSAMLGASGGVLDVIDSLLFAAPVALLVWSSAYPASPLP